MSEIILINFIIYYSREDYDESRSIKYTKTAKTFLSFTMAGVTEKPYSKITLQHQLIAKFREYFKALRCLFVEYSWRRGLMSTITVPRYMSSVFWRWIRNQRPQKTQINQFERISMHTKSMLRRWRRIDPQIRCEHFLTS